MSQFPNRPQMPNYNSTQPPFIRGIDISVPSNSHVQIDFYINNPPPPVQYRTPPPPLILGDQRQCLNQPSMVNTVAPHWDPRINQPFMQTVPLTNEPVANHLSLTNYSSSNLNSSSLRPDIQQKNYFNKNSSTKFASPPYNNSQFQDTSAVNFSRNETTPKRNSGFFLNPRPLQVNSENVNSTLHKLPLEQNYHNPTLINIKLNNYVDPNNQSNVDTNSKHVHLIKSESLVKSEDPLNPDLKTIRYDGVHRGDGDAKPKGDRLHFDKHSSQENYKSKWHQCSRSISPGNVKERFMEKQRFTEKRPRRSHSISPVNEKSYSRERKCYRTITPRNGKERLTEKKTCRSRSITPTDEKSYSRGRRCQRSISPTSKKRPRRSRSNKKTNSKERRVQPYSISHSSFSKNVHSQEKDRDKTSPSHCSISPKEEEEKTESKMVTSTSSSSTSTMNEKCQTQRDKLLEKWREASETVNNESDVVWVRTAPAELYYRKQPGNPEIVEATEKLKTLCEDFDNVLVKRAELVRSELPKYNPTPRKKRMKVAKHKSMPCSSSDSDSDSDHEDCTIDELERKKLHPYRLHPELWYNDPGEVNDGPLCRCSARARRSGIRHNIYAGELSLRHCDILTNNADKLYHYRITISPPTNFLVRTPTIINYDEHEYIFEGFSMFSHGRLYQLPVCKVIRFNIEYTILYEEEKLPENFTIRELDLFYDYLFHELLELVDLDLKAAGDSTGCSQFHFMPRFVRELPDHGKEILPMNEVLRYLIKSSAPLIEETTLDDTINLPQHKWQSLTEEVKGMVVTYPGRKPCSLRVDQLDRDQGDSKTLQFPEIVHFGIRPPQLSYAGNPEYQKAWREYVKFRHLLANMPKPSYTDKRKLEDKENRLQDMRTQSKMKRDVTVTVSSKHFCRTGIMCDIVQHAMLIPVLVSHLRFHRSLDILEEKIDYKFKNRYLLQLALTHPSYRENFGTNPDHARNSLTNCGIRQPVYGDRRIHYMNTRKRGDNMYSKCNELYQDGGEILYSRDHYHCLPTTLNLASAEGLQLSCTNSGINTLINIMSRFGKKTETESNITHNERLEFLGDAVVEFVTSIHLFHMFPDLEEGGLATYRAAIVQNQHLAVLAKTLNLEEYMLYAHGSDLCHDLELRHAMANCFEALMGALFLDGGIKVADKVFGETLFKNEPPLLRMWVNYPPHPLQEQEPLGDRRWISSFPLLQNLSKFEMAIGVEFKHIRLLARAFTDRSIGFTNLTLGSNQRLEFLGDTVLQLIASEYLYKYFPEHHEGHLSLLRSSLVNNRTQSVVCNDLGMASYALYSNPKAELKTKDRADLLEAFLGALYVDQGLDHCQTFCSVCFFPRLQDFIMHQDWNDPKSKLQQCCLTLRTMEGGEPEIPVYKVIECMGPTNTRIYTVAVYFKGQRLASASGHSIQQAEMNAAKKALELSEGLFPQLDHQKRVISKSMKRQRRSPARHSRYHYWSSSFRYNDSKRRSRSRNRRSYSRDRRSYSRNRHSRSRDRLSYSRDRHSRSRDRRSYSRDRHSRSRDRRSYSRDRHSRSRETSRAKSKTYQRNRSCSSEGRKSSSPSYRSSSYRNKSKDRKYSRSQSFDSDRGYTKRIKRNRRSKSRSKSYSSCETSPSNSSTGSTQNKRKYSSDLKSSNKDVILPLVPIIKKEKLSITTPGENNTLPINEHYSNHPVIQNLVPKKTKNMPFIVKKSTENLINSMHDDVFSQGSSIYPNNIKYKWQSHPQPDNVTVLQTFNVPPPVIHSNTPHCSSSSSQNVFYNQSTSNNLQNYSNELYDNIVTIKVNSKDNSPFC